MNEVQEQINKCNSFIKKLREGARELNHKADEIAKMKSELKVKLRYHAADKG